MSVEPIPVWSLYPNWADEIIETWSSDDVGESPSAIEQRRGLRLTPRQYFEVGYALKGPERTYFDLLTMRSGGSLVTSRCGTMSSCCPTTMSPALRYWHQHDLHRIYELRRGVHRFGTHDYELVEIQGRAETLVVLTSPLIFTWPKGTRVVPLKKVRLDQQPATTRRTQQRTRRQGQVLLDRSQSYRRRAAAQLVWPPVRTGGRSERGG
jgi:hypothetical protein